LQELLGCALWEAFAEFIDKVQVAYQGWGLTTQDMKCTLGMPENPSLADILLNRAAPYSAQPFATGSSALPAVHYRWHW
jgi:hypothetical protein